MQKCQKKEYLNKCLEKHLKDVLIHHIHVKCGDEFFTFFHKGGYIEASKLMDKLVEIITGKIECDYDDYTDDIQSVIKESKKC